MLEFGAKVKFLRTQIAVIGSRAMLGYVGQEASGRREDRGADVAIEAALLGACKGVLDEMLLQFLGVRQYHFAQITAILQIGCACRGRGSSRRRRRSRRR